MGYYPCPECGAAFVSVTMTQEPHAKACKLGRIESLERELAEALSDHDVGIRVHLNEVEQPFSLQRGGEGTQMRRAWELGQRLTRSEERCRELETERVRLRTLAGRAAKYLDKYMPDNAGERAVLVGILNDAMLGNWDDGEWDDGAALAGRKEGT